MNPESIQKIIEALERNGGTALDALGGYQQTAAYGDLARTILAPVLVVLLAYVFFRMMAIHDEADRWSKRESLAGVGMTLSAVLGCLALLIFVVGMATLGETIATIKNPKGAAINKLLKGR